MKARIFSTIDVVSFVVATLIISAFLYVFFSFSRIEISTGQAGVAVCNDGDYVLPPGVHYFRKTDCSVTTVSTQGQAALYSTEYTLNTVKDISPVVIRHEPIVIV